MLWSLFVAFWKHLPWVAIALMAGLSLWRRKTSKPLLMQAAGAAGIFLLGVLQWVVVDLILVHTSASYNLINAAQIIFQFLLFISLALFALGYCIERFIGRKSPVQVTATRVD